MRLGRRAAGAAGHRAACSAVLVDVGCSGLDRDLLDAARRDGCAPGRHHGHARDDWAALGAIAVLPEPVDRELLAVLREHASPIERPAAT